MPDVASPCINLCRMNPDTGLCDGCLRTIDEIAAWSGAATSERRRILDAIEVRRDRVPVPAAPRGTPA